MQKIKVNKLVVVNPPFRDEMFFGIITDSEGRTLEIIDNYNCQFNTLRNNGLLRNVPSASGPLPVRVFETDAVLDELQVKKLTDISDEVAVFTGEAFTLDGVTQVCKKVSTGEKAGQLARETAKTIGGYVVDIINSLQNR